MYGDFSGISCRRDPLQSSGGGWCISLEKKDWELIAVKPNVFFAVPRLVQSLGTAASWLYISIRSHISIYTWKPEQRRPAARLAKRVGTIKINKPVLTSPTDPELPKPCLRSTCSPESVFQCDILPQYI